MGETHRLFCVTWDREYEGVSQPSEMDFIKFIKL